MAQIKDESNKLYNLYAGERAREIKDKEMEVENEWNNLRLSVEMRKRQLNDSSDLFKFFNLARDLMMWMETQMREMMNSPEFLAMLSNPAMIQQMMGMMPLMQGMGPTAGGFGATSIL